MMKPPQKFPPTSPNGIKLPIFEPGMAPLGGYNPPPPFPFWHHGFTHIPIDYARNPAIPFPSPELVASQMMQKLQEESSRPLSKLTIDKEESEVLNILFRSFRNDRHINSLQVLQLNLTPPLQPPRLPNQPDKWQNRY